MNDRENAVLPNSHVDHAFFAWAEYNRAHISTTDETAHAAFVAGAQWRSELRTEQPFGAIVAAERERQIAKGYTAEHDDEHSDSDLVSFIVNRLERLNRCVIARDRYEQALVEVAALAAAAFERSRRKPDEVVE